MSQKVNALLDLSSDSTEDDACQVIKPLVHSIFLPEVKSASNQPYSSDDFEEYKQLAEQNFKELNNVFCKVHDLFPPTSDPDIDVGWSDVKTDLVVSVILLCSEHMYEELWTTNCTHSNAQQLLNNLLIYLEKQSVKELLFTSKRDLIHLLLTSLRPKLLKGTWKNYPAAAVSYKWIVHNIQSPNLTKWFPDLLPTALIIFDDHENKNKRLALDCLQHIVDNVPATYLEDCNGGLLIYDTVKPLVYFCGDEIFPALISFLIILFSKTEQQPFTTDPSWSRFDDVLSIWLPAMEMEQKISLRKVYIDILPNFLSAMGLPSTRWTKKLLNIFSEYIKERNTCEKALQALALFLKIGWVRLPYHVVDIFVILMETVINKADLQTDCDSCEIQDLVKICLYILKSAAPNEFNEVCRSVKTNSELYSITASIIGSEKLQICQ